MVISVWENRIVESGEVDPRSLVPNPLNARLHPKAQRAALSAVLGEVGWVTRVIANRRTGRLVDGHARVEEAVKRGEKTVPVDWVDLDEGEEASVLATLDPIGAMATYDAEVLGELLSFVSLDDPAVSSMLDALTRSADVDVGGGFVEGDGSSVIEGMRWDVIVSCRDEAHQLELLHRFEAEGLKAKASVV